MGFTFLEVNARTGINKLSTRPPDNMSEQLLHFSQSLLEYKIDQNVWIEVPPHDVKLCARILYVPKKLTFRAVADARLPNSFVVKKHLYVDSLRTQLNYLRGSQVYCSVDGKEMYHQLRYDDTHAIYRIFMNGKFYRQTRMGMGFKNSEAHLQNAITWMCQTENIGYDIMLHAADNFLIHGKDDIDCARNFVKVLKVFEKYGLVISPKCELLHRRVKFMGLTIENGTYYKNPKFLKEFLEMDKPANLGVIQKTMNSLAFMKDHINDFSTLHQHLAAFIVANTPPNCKNINRIAISDQIWNGLILESWNLLKERSSQPLRFSLPTPNQPKLIIADSSNYGYGYWFGEISEEDFQKESLAEMTSFKLIAASSGTWNDAQLKLTNTLRELAASVIAAKRTFAWHFGCPTRIFTDHKNNTFEEKFDPNTHVNLHYINPTSSICN